MEAILARRFAPLNFSAVPGFPNPMPPPSVWMDLLPVFKEEKEGNPAQHLVAFHQCMNQLDIRHQDVLMKMFMCSLKGNAREWYFSLPGSSICSLKDFHAAFNERCKRFFSHELLLEDCCEEINHIEPTENIEQSSLKISKLASTVLEPEPADNNKQCIFSSEISLQPCSDLQTAVSLQPYSDLQAVEDGSISQEEDMQRFSDFQLKQQEKVFVFSFTDPFADYLESLSNIDVKSLLSNEDWLLCSFELHFDVPWLFSVIISRSEISLVSHLLVWLHWKHDFT